MKKLFLSAFLAMVTAGLFAADDFRCGFWFDAPKGISSANVEGVSIGLPVCAMRSIKGAELTLCGGTTDNVTGFQWAWMGFTHADTLTGVQLSFLNFLMQHPGKAGVQIGFYNQSAKNGVQLGFINNGENNATFQFGLVNINTNGLLPVMIFVNFGKDFFD